MNGVTTTDAEVNPPPGNSFTARNAIVAGTPSDKPEIVTGLAVCAGDKGVHDEPPSVV